MRFYWQRPGSGPPSLEVAVLVVAAPVVALAITMAAGVPLEESSATICTFRRLTGHPCMTCGATRSLAALVHGRLLQAFAWNPAVTTVYLGIALATAYALTVLTFRLPRLRVRVESRREAFLLAAVTVLAAAANWVFVWKTQTGG